MEAIAVIFFLYFGGRRLLFWSASTLPDTTPLETDSWLTKLRLTIQRSCVSVAGTAIVAWRTTNADSVFTSAHVTMKGRAEIDLRFVAQSEKDIWNMCVLSLAPIASQTHFYGKVSLSAMLSPMNEALRHARKLSAMLPTRVRSFDTPWSDAETLPTLTMNSPIAHITNNAREQMILRMCSKRAVYLIATHATEFQTATDHVLSGHRLKQVHMTEICGERAVA